MIEEESIISLKMISGRCEEKEEEEEEETRQEMRGDLLVQRCDDKRKQK